GIDVSKDTLDCCLLLIALSEQRVTPDTITRLIGLVSHGLGRPSFVRLPNATIRGPLTTYSRPLAATRPPLSDVSHNVSRVVGESAQVPSRDEAKISSLVPINLPQAALKGRSLRIVPVWGSRR